MMKTVVEKAFKDIVENRVYKVAYEKAQMDELFVKSDEERNASFNLLNESLTTEDQKHHLSELESLWKFVEGLMQEYAYRQGLEDSQMLHEELSGYGISVKGEQG